MATLEVEDLAALVGIEIVSDGAGKAVIEGSEQQSAQEPDQSTASQPGIEEHGGREAATELLRFDCVLCLDAWAPPALQCFALFD